MKPSTDERREFIFSDVDDDTKRKIRFKGADDAARQPGGRPQLHPSDAECDELDNCFSGSRIEADDGDRG